MEHKSQEQDLRFAAREWLPGEEFDTALAEAKKYHAEHPPLELCGEPTEVALCPRHNDLLQYKKEDIAEINKGTRNTLTEEHRQKLMYYFIRKMVPQLLSEEIVERLILNPQQG